MNKYLKEAMDNAEKVLPKTMEEYSRMHPSDANRVPFSHVEKLKEMSNKIRSSEKVYKPINFN